jgi:DNA-binding MarR family transcriptional regulator
VIRSRLAHRRATADRRVLTALNASPHRSAYGHDLRRATRLRPARLYPALDRLIDAGHVTWEWVEQDEGPSRRLYIATTTEGAMP